MEICRSSPPGARNRNTPPKHRTGTPINDSTPIVPAMMSTAIKTTPAIISTMPAQLNGNIFRPMEPSRSITPPKVPSMKPPGVIISKNIAIIPPERRRYAICGSDTNCIILSLNDISARTTCTSLSSIIFMKLSPTFTRRPFTAVMRALMSPATMSITPALRASVAVSDMLSSIIFSVISWLRPLICTTERICALRSFMTFLLMSPCSMSLPEATTG